MVFWQSLISRSRLTLSYLPEPKRSDVNRILNSIYQTFEGISVDKWEVVVMARRLTRTIINALRCWTEWDNWISPTCQPLSASPFNPGLTWMLPCMWATSLSLSLAAYLGCFCSSSASCLMSFEFVRFTLVLGLETFLQLTRFKINWTSRASGPQACQIFNKQLSFFSGLSTRLQRSTSTNLSSCSSWTPLSLPSAARSALMMSPQVVASTIPDIHLVLLLTRKGTSIPGLGGGPLDTASTSPPLVTAIFTWNKGHENIMVTAVRYHVSNLIYSIPNALNAEWTARSVKDIYSFETRDKLHWLCSMALSVSLIEKSTLDLFLNACVPHPLPYIMSKTSVFDWSFLITWIHNDFSLQFPRTISPITWHL